MFRDACRKARGFTRPIFSVWRHIDGRAGHSAASLVIVNPHGWFVTAAHIFTPLTKAMTDASAVQEYTQQKSAIEAQPLDRKHKQKQLAKLPFDPDWITAVKYFWMNGPIAPFATKVLHVSGPHDIAAGQIADFDASSVSQYPVFKRSDDDVEPGAALCRMGFPFAKTDVTLDGSGNANLNVDEITYFPNEAMFTRHIGLDTADASGDPLPRFIETSTPGLRGQSGGPVFDQLGTVWGIQSHTTHMPLGFDPPDPKKPSQTIHQFLNVGKAVHPSILQWFLTKHGIQFEST
jgi:hypothetical protein